jgi:putative intracellular protease/amidase
MSANINVLNENKRKKILIIVANQGLSSTTGWPIGFWWAELTHPYFEFVENGYEVEVVSPKGG